MNEALLVRINMWLLYDKKEIAFTQVYVACVMRTVIDRPTVRTGVHGKLVACCLEQSGSITLAPRPKPKMRRMGVATPPSNKLATCFLIFCFFAPVVRV